MEKQYLTEAQMQYLMFLGVNTRDASMSVDIHLPKMDKEILWGFNEDSNDMMFKTIPLYTLQDLLNKMPKNIKKEQYNCNLTIEYINSSWSVSYTDFDYDVVSYKDECLIDAVYCMFIWCILNKYIEK